MAIILDDDFIEFLEYLNNNNNETQVIRRQYIRDIQNPLEKYTDNEFCKRYRFSKDIVVNELMTLLNTTDNSSKRGLPVPKIVCGDLQGLHQTTVCRIINRTAREIAMHLPRYVKFPEASQLRQLKERFYQISGFPNVIGCIDCTHIPIKSPGGPNGEVYRNRKGWMSLNVQVVGGPNYEIFDIVIRWPGSAHDSRIFENSAVKVRLESGLLDGNLLGDAGYAQTKYLFTPLLTPSSEAEERYNCAHKRTRVTVERLFGIWKKRFPCLSRKFMNDIENVQIHIAACAVLQNIGKGYEFSDFQLEQNEEEEEGGEQLIVAHVGQESRRGRAIRDAFIERHFT